MIKAALFDMDGLLFDSERLYSKAVPDIAKQLGYSMDDSFFIKTLGVSNRECRKLYEDAFGADFPFEKAGEMLFSFVLDFNRRQTMPLKEGALQCLAALHGRGMPLVLATSSPRFVVEGLFASLPTLDALFAGKVCGDEVTVGKPGPEIYQKAAALAGFPPAECIGVEDSKSGLRAIRAAGATSVMIPDLLPYTDALEPYTDYVLRSLTELEALIDQING